MFNHSTTIKLDKTKVLSVQLGKTLVLNKVAIIETGETTQNFFDPKGGRGEG